MKRLCKFIKTMKGDFRIFVEWFPEKLQLSGEIQGFVKEGLVLVVDFWSRGSPEAIRLLFLKNKNDANYEICIKHSHNINYVGLINGIQTTGLGCGGWRLP